MDIRRPRDGRVLEELGTYDPLIPETDARVRLDGERANYWLSVGAQPSEAVRVFIKKYGLNGTHLTAQQTAVARLAESRRRPEPMAPLPRPPKPQKRTEDDASPKGRRKAAAEEPAADAPAAEAPAAEAPAAEAPAPVEATAGQEG
jgi:small subunit ribosomal protein S16